MIRVLQDLGHERALVFYGEDGLDELTTTGLSRVFELKDGSVKAYELDPKDLGLGRSRPEDLRGGTPAENAALLAQVLDGEAGPRREVVVLNAAAAILAAGKSDTWPEAMAIARESLDSGRAKQTLTRLVETSKSPANPSPPGGGQGGGA
jgi:anthranilate phosphoribosyltransferase